MRLTRRLELLIPPAAVAVASALLMWLLARATPAWALDIPARFELAVALAAGGAAVALAGVGGFRRARTTVNPLRPDAATALVDSGVYRASRNPMYLGIAIVLLAWAIHLSSPLALTGIVMFLGYMTYFQIIPEERALRALFPGDYEEYSRRVRRWI